MDVKWVAPTPQVRAEDARRAWTCYEPTTHRKLSVYTPSAPVIEHALN